MKFYAINYNNSSIIFVMNLIIMIIVSEFHGLDGVPLSILNNNDLTPSNSIDGDVTDDGDSDVGLIVDDDFTTHALERLSSAATCLVAGVEYTHGQQIYRTDQCEFCLCLDGEMFCWWQDCPPTMEGPCKDRGPFTQCLNVPSSSSSRTQQTTSTNTNNNHINKPINETTSSILYAETTSTTTNVNNNSSVDSIATTTDLLIVKALTSNINNSIISNNNNNNNQSTNSNNDDDNLLLIDKSKQHCLIMGREYEIGEKLPQTTGNCIECICGQGAKVTCSPYQCAPASQQDINDYRSPGPRHQLSDVF